MKLRIPFVTRARMDRELDAVREVALQHAEQASARFARQLAEAAAAKAKAEASETERRRQLAEAVAANTRLAGRNSELSRRLDSAHDQELGELADISALEARAARADELAALLRASERRGDRLQSRLDDACGLNSAAIEKRRIVQASPAKEDAS